MIRISTIGDIHVGSHNTESLYNQLEKEFFNVMKDFKPDLLVNLGDITDHKLLMNSLDAELFLDIGYKMKEYSKQVFVVSGTLSHDQFQTRLYKHLLSETFRIFYKAEIAYLDNLSFLILPEEYDLKENYYDRFFDNTQKYDFVFGHGMFSHVGSYARNLSNIIQSKHAKVWNWKEFENKVYGSVIFGHIHIGSEYKNIIYPSSFSRDSFGEEDPKGFYIFEYDEIQRKIIKKEFIENKIAPKYKDIKISKIPEISDINDFLKYLRNESENNYKVRIVIDKDISDEYYNNILAFIKNFNNTTMIKKIPKQLTEKDIKQKEKIEEINSTLLKFRDKNFYEITQILLKEKYNKDITVEEINQILSK